MKQSEQHIQTGFSLVAITLHWLIAILTILLFILGLWMVTLDYYNSWYQVAPKWHKNFGVLVGFLVIIRWLWYVVKSRPQPLATLTKRQYILSRLVHISMDLFIVLITISGYLMVTAKGQSLVIFDMVVIPAVIDGIANMEDSAGLIHCYLAYILIALAIGHSSVALKHHYVDKDTTLLRMLSRNIIKK